MATLTSFSDNFDGAVINESVWSVSISLSDVSVSGGLLTIGGTNGGNITTIDSYDATTGGFKILFSSFADVDEDIYVRIRDDDSGDAGFLISDADGLIYFYLDDGDLVYEEDTVAYDGSSWTDNYFRLRIDESNNLFWETSSDGTSWTERFTYQDLTSIFNYASVVIDVTAFAAVDNVYDIHYIHGIDSAGGPFSNGILSLPSAGTMFPLTSA